MSHPIVLDIGQCAMDHGSIRRVVESIGGKVLRAATTDEALSLVAKHSVSLILVNRVFDMDGSDGLQAISALIAATSGGVPVMLVSNYPEYQERAIKLGAVPGFGKSSLGSAQTRELLRGVLLSR
jgi:response regulator RpfG family c-di-GMP phosphodiesterase